MTFTESLEMVHEDLDRLHNEMVESRKADKTKKQYQDDLRYFSAQLNHFSNALYSIIENFEPNESSGVIKELFNLIKEKIPYSDRADFAWRTGISEVIE